MGRGAEGGGFKELGGGGVNLCSLDESKTTCPASLARDSQRESGFSSSQLFFWKIQKNEENTLKSKAEEMKLNFMSS